jgi:hypothetical protein
MEAMWFRGVWVRWVGPLGCRVEETVLPVIGYGLAHFVLQNSFNKKNVVKYSLRFKI